MEAQKAKEEQISIHALREEGDGMKAGERLRGN